ncbi:MAG: bifunctional glutamate N-acetyltransferase/amino-acid acetyltransferase ArgJ [Planctomycetota bacterium]|jgi:glutamate N-acetyltransferase/amino-acid N-acetyltransferase
MAATGKPKLTSGGLPLWKVPGFRCGAAYAGIQKKKPGQLDVGLLYAPEGAAAAGVFTRNQAAAAPVLVSRPVASRGRVSAVVVNAGNANACTGRQGVLDAREMISLTAAALGVPRSEVLVASTGVIGRPLPMEKIRAGIWDAALQATAGGRGRLSRAILTTDLVVKRAACRLAVGSGRATVAGITKGSGMIAPNMATTLSFLVTDVRAGAGVLRKILRAACDESFNCLTVDGEASTNDCMFLLASGRSKASVTRSSGRAYGKLREAVTAVCVDLARQIARDGEGATKLVTVNVRGARSARAARVAARAVADSLLVKTAMFGCDPNWGRILSAIGQTGAGLDLARARVTVGGVPVYDRRPLAVDARKAARRLKRREVGIDVDLRLGKGRATVYTCDLSYKYVEINAEYHT